VTTFVVLSTALFVALYVPAIARFSRALASPYGKANVRRRLAAAAIDSLLVITCLGFYTALGSPSFVAAGAAYTLLRDAVSGQSIGKFVFSLIVIRLENGRPCNLSRSAARNAMFLLPGANVAAVLLESLTIARDPKGQRLGDRLAQTQVVDGLGARELIKMFQEALLEVSSERVRRRRASAEVG
jgi:uncharacterized RDD family membrane protein YckC